MRVILGFDEANEIGGVSTALSANNHEVLEYRGPDEGLARLARVQRPDLIIVDGTWLGATREPVLRTLYDDGLAPVIVLVRELADRMTAAAIRSGVMNTLRLEVDPAEIIRGLPVVVKQWRAHRGVVEELARERLLRDEQGVVQKAKILLMRRLGLPEDVAYRRIQKSAMDHRMSKGKVAEAILLTASMGLLFPLSSAAAGTAAPDVILGLSAS